MTNEKYDLQIKRDKLEARLKQTRDCLSVLYLELDNLQPRSVKLWEEICTINNEIEKIK